MADPARARKLAKRIGTIVATAIEQEARDPRLEFITVTDTRVTADLHDATVYYTVRGADMNTAPDYDGAAEALTKIRGSLRTRVGAGTGVRYTPTLAFVRDDVPEAARRMEDLVARVREQDEERARASAGAVPAGEADPYRRPGDAGDGDQAELPS